MALQKPLVYVGGVTQQLQAGDTLGVEAHKTTHQDGGADELSVAGLSGLLADPQTAGSLKTATTSVAISSSAAPTVGQILVADSGTAATWRTVGSVTEPVTAATTLGGSTTETAIAAMKVAIPANTMAIGHSVRWTAIVNQLNFISGTVTLKIHYGPLGTTADALVATLAFAASTALAVTPQFLMMYLTVRGPLGAGCAAMANAKAEKSQVNGIGGAFSVAMATSTMATFTANPAILNYWTVSYTMSAATLTYTLNQTLTELVEW